MNALLGPPPTPTLGEQSGETAYDECNPGAPGLQTLHRRQASRLTPRHTLSEAAQQLGVALRHGPSERATGLALSKAVRHARDTEHTEQQDRASKR